jgi:hypothetical protein
MDVTILLTILAGLILLSLLVMMQRAILGPFVLRANHIAPREQGFEEIPDDQAQILFSPMSLESAAELNAIGFALVCHLVSSRFRRTRTAVSLFVNRETNTQALVGRVATKVRLAGRAPVGFVEFFSHFDDGTQVSTINTPTVQVFYDMPERIVNRVPHLKDTFSLLAVHQYVAGQKSGSAVLPDPGMEAAFFREQIKRTHERQVELGYYVLDQSGENYRLTWKAAFRSTWRLSWPLKQILKQKHEREGRRLAAEAARVESTVE